MDLLNLLLVEEVTAHFELEFLGKRESAQVPVEGAGLLLHLLVALSAQPEQRADHVQKVSEGHAAEHLQDGDDEAFEVI